MVDKYEFDSEIREDNSISVPEHLQDKFPPALKVNVALEKHKQQEMPTHLYKYRSMPTDVHKLMALFVENKLWFTHPQDFNDPFDSRVHLDCSASSLFELQQIYRTYINQNFPEEYFSTEHIDIAANKFLIRGDDENMLTIGDRHVYTNEKILNINIDYIRKIGEENILQVFRQFLDTIGIFSFTEHRDNILMWSHYADNHKGFCLEFDISFIDKMYKQQRWDKYAKVDYDQHYFTPSELAKVAKTEFAQKVFFRKSSHWKYENEWRIIALREVIEDNVSEKEKQNWADWVSNKNRYIEFPSEMLSGIIFGLEMSEQDENAIRHCVNLNDKLKHVRFYRVDKKKNEFGLDIVLLPE